VKPILRRQTIQSGGKQSESWETQSAASVEASVDCKSAAELICMSLDGQQLPNVVAEGLRRHVDSCPPCAAIMNEQVQLQGLLGNTFKERNISDSFTVQTGERLNQRRKVMQDHPTTSPEALTAVHFNGETGETEYVFDDDEENDGSGFFAALAGQFGSAPWWVTSGVFHGLLILLIYFIGEIILTVNADDKIITTTLDERQEIEPEKKQVQRDLIDKVLPETDNLQVIEDPVVTHEQVQEADHHETDDNQSEDTARGDEDCISDVPLGGKGTVAAIGVGGGRGGAFGQRGGGGKQHLLRRGGGGADTEDAVGAALAWLARHQEPDGSWDNSKYGGGGSDVAVTGFSLLAFLGAGHTEKVGKYRENVRKAVKWLIAKQREDGAFWDSGRGYAHAIAGMAMAEAAGMGRIKETREAAQKAITYSTEIHQQGEGSEKLGWRYQPKQAGDTSVVGWFVMQLKSAKVCGLDVNPASFDGASKFLDQVESKGAGRDDDYGPVLGYGYTGKGSGLRTSAIGLLCRQFLGWEKEKLEGGVRNFMQRSLPQWPGNIDLYYWYYGTLCVFQQGGDMWKEWNTAMKGALLPNQCKGGPKDGSLQDTDGSWDPIGAYTKAWGRVGQTAVAALCLEVYYRYLPMYR
jgi:hypothetical protein